MGDQHALLHPLRRNKIKSFREREAAREIIILSSRIKRRRILWRARANDRYRDFRVSCSRGHTYAHRTYVRTRRRSLLRQVDCPALNVRGQMCRGGCSHVCSGVERGEDDGASTLSSCQVRAKCTRCPVILATPDIRGKRAPARRVKVRAAHARAARVRARACRRLVKLGTTAHDRLA